MSLTVVLGTVDKIQVDPKSVRDAAVSTNNTQSPQAASAQNSIARAALNSDAVVSTLRSSIRSSTVAGGEPIRDFSKAEKLAGEVADKIRENKDGEATGAHDGLSSEKSASTLVN